MNKYAEVAQAEMIGQVDPWPNEAWWNDLGEQIEAKVNSIRDQLLSNDSTLTYETAQTRAQNEAIFWLVGVAYLSWEVPDEIHDQLWPTPQPLPPPSLLLHQIRSSASIS